MGAVPSPAGRRHGAPLEPITRQVMAAQDDTEAVITRAVGAPRKTRTLRLLRLAVSLSREARSPVVTPQAGAPRPAGRNVQPRVTVVPIPTTPTESASAATARLLDAVTRSVTAPPYLPRHGAGGTRELVHEPVMEAGLFQEPAHDLPTGSVAGQRRVDALSDPVGTPEPPDGCRLVSPARRASGVRPSARARQEEGTPLAGPGPPQGGIPALRRSRVAPCAVASSVPPTQVETGVRPLVIPSRQGVEPSERDDAAVIQGRLRTAAPRSTPPVAVSSASPHNGVPILNGLRIGV